MKTVVVRSQQRWDYWCENRKTENSMLVALNELGQQGWELVDVSHHKDQKGEMCWTAFLKRPSITQTPQQPSGAAANAPATGPAAQGSPQAQGFDLSDKAFKLKGE
jgi:hypothetical protein